MSDINWKNYLLKSGLPFEYEVKECFAKQGCTVWDEYSYIKEDENKIEKEFSYDIDANYWKGGNSFDFMIECKYKTEPTKWFFMPDSYSYQSELNQNSFLHPLDHFTDNKFLFNKAPYYKVNEPLGPFCLKGTEIFQNQYVETNIFKAINQLSYAFIEKIISGMRSQFDDEIFDNCTFFHIPIIITNAGLHVINDKLTTKDIQNANSIEQISTKQDFLFFHNKIGENLRIHNFKKIYQFFDKEYTEKFNSRQKSFTDDLEHFIEVISSNYSPQIILIMHHDDAHENYKKLFDYINFLAVHSEKLTERIETVKKEFDEKMKNMGKRIRKKKTDA